ncbi:Cys-tRNA(Pro) deacylase [Glutamicibacter endophyticus]|uniref:Cys-tRNA(Pro) deacylase n=1 Tax=Glutamicibacter endophyticus TaxID=1522174 RepID=UPI003AF04D79
MGKRQGQSGTPATVALEAAGVPYTAHHYAHRAQSEGYGAEAARALHVSPARVFKTLMVATGAQADRDLAVAIVPADSTLDLKACAQALGCKRVQMADPQAAQRRTGYVLGGISPFGQRHLSPTVIDRSALEHESIFLSGGRRGFSLELAPERAVAFLGASVAPVASGTSLPAERG